MDAFDFQGFGVLSEWNGQIKSLSARQAMADIAAIGANSIEITPRIWTQTTTSNEVISEPSKTESDASLIQGIANAHGAGLKVILKPNISTLDRHGSSDLAPSDVAAFFDSYKTQVVHLAEVAQQTGTEMLALGNEMSSLSGAAYRGYWLDIIDSVRAVYHGEITYAAATDEASRVSFWDALDIVGVNTYPPLSVPNEPTVNDIVNAWHQVPANPYWAKAFNHLSPVDFLHSLATQYGKPVLMTEAGYRSMDYGSTITGSWTISGPMDLQEQAKAYAAFLQVWGNGQNNDWLKGVEFWQWDLSGKFSPTGFSPMDKPAEALIAEYFKGAGALAALPVEQLTHEQIAALSAFGIKTLVATEPAKVSGALAADLGAAHISLSTPYGDGAQTWTWNTDGTLHDIHYYAVKGGTYTDYNVIYNELGKQASATYSDGSSAAWTYNSDGALYHFVQNDIVGKAWTTTDTTYGQNGKPLFETWHKGDTLVQTQSWNADGSLHDVHYYNVTGQAFTEYAVDYGANNKEAFAAYSNGMTKTWAYNADSTLHTITYDNVPGQNYTSYTAGYGENRTNVVQQFISVNGNETIRGYADHLTFTSTAQGETVMTASGHSFTFADNAHTTLTGGGAPDMFVFEKGFGQVTITNFVPNAMSGASHDQLAFAPDVFASFADMMQHAAQSGANTVITDAHGDSLVLQHVTLAQLGDRDFLVV